ncbi:palindromic element RPE1 domain-containing protein [Rickettsia asiatica]|nr:palindromic element RPE1 domain-containing protein [Rickettsia asiatica]
MQNRSVVNLREDSSTGLTYKLPLEVNFARNLMSI